MKKFLTISLLIISLGVVLYSTTNVLAATGDNLGTISGGLVPCSTHANGTYETPCTLCHFIIGFKNLIDFASKILVTVALAGIFFAGLIYIISSGNEGMMTQAKGFLKASVTGFAIVLGAWLIVNVTMWTLSVKTGNNPEDSGFAGIQKDDWFNFTCSTASSSTSSTSVPTANIPTSAPIPIVATSIVCGSKLGNVCVAVPWYQTWCSPGFRQIDGKNCGSGFICCGAF